MSIKYLTKSRFKLATECPTKLFYTGKKRYANKSLDDPFLEGLAEGGYQVGDQQEEFDEPTDYGFLEVWVFPADYTFGDEPIARTNTQNWDSGKYEITLPPGKYKLKVNSHQSTYNDSWYKGPDANASDVFTWDDAYVIDLTSSDKEDVDVELGAAPTGYVSGTFKDKSDANVVPGWAELTLHDKDDEDTMYWPGNVERWSNTSPDMTKDYVMMAPAGTYKVKVEFFDGTYVTSYYKKNDDGSFGTTSFADADTITITTSHTESSPLANINFDLAGAPTGIIKGKVVDKDTGVFSGDWYSVILRGAN